MKKERIEVYFNRDEYNMNRTSLEQNIKKIILCLEAVEQIMGVKELKPIKEIEDYIISKSGFDNIEMSAKLLNIDTAYYFLTQNLPKINLDVIEWIEGTPSTKEEILLQVKEKNTTYLSNDLYDDYKVLEKATSILNQLSNPTYINALTRDYMGKYNLNALSLQNMNTR